MSLQLGGKLGDILLFSAHDEHRTAIQLR
jgi:hypothetical protein